MKAPMAHMAAESANETAASVTHTCVMAVSSPIRSGLTDGGEEVEGRDVAGTVDCFGCWTLRARNSKRRKKRATTTLSAARAAATRPGGAAVASATAT